MGRSLRTSEGWGRASGPGSEGPGFQGFSFLAAGPRGFGNLNQKRSHSQDSWQEGKEAEREGDKGSSVHSRPEGRP